MDKRNDIISRFLWILLVTVTAGSCAGAKGEPHRVTLNYIEYNRGISSAVTADLQMTYGDRNLTFSGVRFDHQSFFPDNAIIPNAFIDPLFRLDFSAAADAFTEPYYGLRIIHFFKKNPSLGLGVEFIHHKIFLDDGGQVVRVSGTDGGGIVDEMAPVEDYLDYFSVSHGINHLGVTVVYRWFFAPTPRIPEGRLQPFVSAAAGPTIPHLEVKLRETAPEWEAYTYQAGLRNFGLGLGLGARYKVSPHFGVYLEYKLTYSHLHGMRLEGRSDSGIAMHFTSHHLQWGLSLIL